MINKFTDETKKLSRTILKSQIKEINEKIKFLKSNLKISKRINNKEIQEYFKKSYEYFLARFPNSNWDPIFEIQHELRLLSFNVRKKHIVYSMLKGNEYSVIERNPHEPLSESKLNKYIEEELKYAFLILSKEKDKNNE